MEELATINNEIEKFNGLSIEIAKYKVAAAVVPNVDTREGEIESRLIRKNGVALKGVIKKAQQSVNSKLKASMSAVKGMSDDLQAEVIAMYTPHDEAIKEVDAKREKIKAEKKRKAEEAEARRQEFIASMEAIIGKMRDMQVEAVTSSVEAITESLKNIESTEVGDNVAEYKTRIVQERVRTINTLKNILKQKEAQAEAERKLAEQRAELDRRMAESKAKAEALAKAKKLVDEQVKLEELRKAKAEAEEQARKLQEMQKREADIKAREEKLAQSEEAEAKKLEVEKQDNNHRDEVQDLVDAEACELITKAQSDAHKALSQYVDEQKAHDILLAIIAGSIPNVQWCL